MWCFIPIDLEENEALYHKSIELKVIEIVKPIEKEPIKTNKKMFTIRYVAESHIEAETLEEAKFILNMGTLDMNKLDIIEII